MRGITNKDRENKMVNKTLPKKTWREQKKGSLGREGEELERLLARCMENEEGCETTRVEEKDKEEDYTIRCRRHHKRIKVTRGWREQCSWLCPQCYEKLTAEERARYAPKETKREGEAIVEKGGVVGKAEEGKTTEGIEEREVGEEGFKEAKQAEVVAAMGQGERLAKPKAKQVREKEPMVMRASPQILALLPEWEMECKKCGKRKPVHKIWLDTKSKVLCPECYFAMSEYALEQFGKEHPEEEAVFRKVDRGINEDIGLRVTASGESSSLSQWLNDTTRRIPKLTDKELLYAVDKGLVSKARARIEIRRRQNMEYFNEFADFDPLLQAR